MLVNLKDLHDKYFRNAPHSMSVADMRFREDSMLDLPKYIVISVIKNGGLRDELCQVPDTFWDELYQKRTDRLQRDEDETRISQWRLQGMKAEKDRSLEKAIAAYKECIRLGENTKYDLFYAYGYAYNRIIVCLRKAREFSQEAWYLREYLKHYEEYPDSRERLWAEKRLYLLLENHLH